MTTSLQVLIVEDRSSDAELMLCELRRAGYDPDWGQVETETDYVAHLDPAPDIILADYNLPQFNASRALHLLQACALDVPFIVVSGSISEEVAVDCMKRGAADYLLKDRLTRLGPAVARALEQKRLRDEKQRAEAALRESEQSFRLLAENATDMISRQTPAGVYLYASPACQTLLGYAPEEMVGRLVDDLTHPEDRTAGMQPDEVNGAETTDIVTVTHRLRTKDGRYVWFETTRREVREPTAGRSLEIHAVSRDITERKQAEEQTKASLKEKEVLLREIHHRVKNNLQIISSLLHLQSAHVKDGHDLKIFRESQNRIKSMALIHQKLYQSKDLGRISFSEYVQNLVNHLFKSYGAAADSVTREITAEDVSLGIDTAVPCGLIINELVSNSLTHAFPTGKGQVSIDFRSAGAGKFTLTVRDNGIGFRGDMNLRKSESLGWQLIDALADQLGAAVEISNQGGTIVKITFGELKYKERK